ncbi:MAG: sodium-dependent transporter [Bacteroides sp.]|nr:sodium-dependent transporter [Bacteroides sp.]MCM1379109.1 sodium-dependent transporter [Bacteroides sp.]MCM1445807.1 sodium-dependent transporter [Prevotella sp.]
MSSSSANQFKSKLGLIAATVGSAVGLGNIWRFPAEAQAGGGAAFLLIYVLCVLLLGIPVMVAEFALGRAGRTDVIGAFAAVTPKKRGWSAVGVLSVITPTLIALFYMVVTGWTLEYLCGSVSGNLFSGGNSSGFFADKMQQYVCTPTLPAIFTAIAVLLNLGVLISGVSKGIERLSNVLMPMLFVLLLIFCGVAMTLPGAGEGLEFFLKPDFSKVTAQTWLSALGQAFFSLSLGMGILVTYAAYYPARTRLVRTAITVSMLDLLVAVMMGIIIFPAVMTFGLQDHSLVGTTLVFVTLPEVFTHLPGSSVWSALFFLLLFIAALTSTVSITEVAVRCLQDRLNYSRRRAVFTLMIPVLLLSIVCSQSFSSLSGFTIFGRNLFDFLDFLTAELLLPIASIGLCLYMGWVAPKKLLHNQMTNFGHFKSRLFMPVLLIVRYVAPVLILLVLISPLL